MRREANQSISFGRRSPDAKKGGRQTRLDHVIQVIMRVDTRLNKRIYSSKGNVSRPGCELSDLGAVKWLQQKRNAL